MDENLNPMEQQPEISEAPAAEPVLQWGDV